MKLNNMKELNLQEEKLLEELISRSNIKIPSTWKNNLLVSRTIVLSLVILY